MAQVHELNDAESKYIINFHDVDWRPKEYRGHTMIQARLRLYKW